MEITCAVESASVQLKSRPQKKDEQLDLWGWKTYVVTGIFALTRRLTRDQNLIKEFNQIIQMEFRCCVSFCHVLTRPRSSNYCYPANPLSMFRQKQSSRSKYLKIDPTCISYIIWSFLKCGYPKSSTIGYHQWETTGFGYPYSRKSPILSGPKTRLGLWWAFWDGCRATLAVMDFPGQTSLHLDNLVQWKENESAPCPKTWMSSNNFSDQPVLRTQWLLPKI